jgi:redox-sensitive bicupin YhaK (pirin superfamily)
MHRDSEGNALEITPGAMNLMTAGRGIAHSERSPIKDRDGKHGLFFIQSWIALPQTREEMAPVFEHFDAAELPVVEDAGVHARVIAGASFGEKSPVGMVSEWFYTEVLLNAGASAPLDADHEERAIYVAEGEVDIAGDKFEAPQLLVFRPGDRITVKATRPARLMFLGGAALEGPRYIWWNFVSSRKERIEQAKEEWKSGKFALIPGDDKEFIPLPDK